MLIRALAAIKQASSCRRLSVAARLLMLGAVLSIFSAAVQPVYAADELEPRADSPWVEVVAWIEAVADAGLGDSSDDASGHSPHPLVLTPLVDSDRVPSKLAFRSPVRKVRVPFASVGQIGGRAPPCFDAFVLDAFTFGA